MPLIHSKSKKAFKENVETEMHAGKPQKQALAIAYEMKRKNAKKMAKGGMVNESAKSEHRPMPSEADKDAKDIAHNAMMKAPKQDSWTGQPTVAQARKPSRVALSAPRIVGSDAFSVRRRDETMEEKHMEDSMPPASPKAKPSRSMDEEDAMGYGPSPSDMEREHSNGRKPYAKGGMVAGAEDDEVEHPAGLEEDDDMMAPPVDEYMAKKMAHGGSVEDDEEIMSAIKPASISRPDNGFGAIIHKSHGGMIDEEAEEEHHASIADAIMAKAKKKMMAEGGMVDIEENEEEQPNAYYRRNQEVLKEQYGEDTGEDPMDSNEIGDEREDESENRLDRVSAIRRRMGMR